MKNKKPRNRANSNMKRLTLVSRYVMKGLAVVFTLGEKATFINMKTKAAIPASPEMINAAQRVQHNWKVYTAVMLENRLGERYVTVNDCSPARACYQENMLDNLNDEHVKQIDATKLADRVNAGWVAIPSGVDLTEAEVVALLECLPCWDVYERGDIKTKTDKARETSDLIRRLEAIV
jgi:hypothetical protein